MDIASDIVAVQSRIAEITGAPPPAAQTGAADNFASLVRKAMQGNTAENAMPGPGIPTVPSSAAPAMVPPAQIDSLVSTNAAAWQVDPVSVKLDL